MTSSMLSFAYTIFSQEYNNHDPSRTQLTGAQQQEQEKKAKPPDDNS